MAKERINVYLPRDLVKKSKQLAKTLDDSFSDIVKDALEEYLAMKMDIERKSNR